MRVLKLLCGVVSLCLGVALQANPVADVALGESIYLRGVVQDGQPLRATRAKVGAVQGRDAACVGCHRPSGLGSVEGDVVIPPITGRALFGGGDPVVVRSDRRFDPGLSAQHAHYDAGSFANAVRLGKHISGRDMHPLMPRYELTDEQLAAVQAYLRSLSNAWSPGVTDTHIRLATIVTPDVAPDARQAFLNTLQTQVAQININIHSGQRQKVSAVERRVQARRHWTLDVWELQGPAEGWAQQLAERQRQAPVFAVLSGLGGTQWQPVHDFCEQQRVVCWFPSVDVPPASATQGQFNLYFADRVGTEAQVLARAVRGGRVLQWIGAHPQARYGARQMRERLTQRSAEAPEVTDQAWPATPAELRAQLQSLRPQDTLVLWLRQDEMAVLKELPAPPGTVLASATVTGADEPAVPPEWRRNLSMAQALETPALRAANLERFNAWLAGSRVPVVDPRMQAEVYFAARSLLYTLRSMLNNFHTPYLIERAETTVSMFESMQVQEEIQAAMMAPVNKRPATAQPAPDPAVAARQHERIELMRQRGGTTPYPKLSLAPGQRVASKGAYLLRLNPQANGFLDRPEWLLP